VHEQLGAADRSKEQTPMNADEMARRLYDRTPTPAAQRDSHVDVGRQDDADEDDADGEEADNDVEVDEDSESGD
jgi:hypothetical protein